MYFRYIDYIHHMRIPKIRYLLVLSPLILISAFFHWDMYIASSKTSKDLMQNPSQGLNIDVWYGHEQRFGHLGQPQRWVNVLGTISDSSQVKYLSYTLNELPLQSLSIGSDLHRLAMPGDFNVELGWDEMKSGLNNLVIKVENIDQTITNYPIKLHIEKGNQWPLPYHIDFSKVRHLQDVVQVVDGHWNLVSTGVHTVQPYYDRVLSMGDTTWRDYESRILLTIHDFTPSSPGPPTYNVSHFGVAMRWRGHHTDGRQPSRKWYPLGAQGELLLEEHPDSNRWRILFDGQYAEKPPTYTSQRNTVSMGKPIWIKTQVQTLPDGRTRYRFKQWPEARSEPLDWDVEGYEKHDYPSGALCIVPHNSSVTIHKIWVTPI